MQGDGAWAVDWDYNRHDKGNIFRPWGFQTGHLTEWTKLLLQLERACPRPRQPAWIVPRARHFFGTAMARGWDAEHGGLVYGFGPDGAVCDADKYFWVQAESLAAAALLALRSGDARYCRPTSASGPTPGRTSSTTDTAPGTASSAPTTASWATRRARQARPITTPWVPATTCCAPSNRRLCHSEGRPLSATPITMRLLFVADPLEQFNIKKDSTFAMMKEAAARTTRSSPASRATWCGSAAVARRRDDAPGGAERRPGLLVHRAACARDGAGRCRRGADAQGSALRQRVFLRHASAQQAEREGARVFNKPAALRDHPESSPSSSFPS